MHSKRRLRAVFTLLPLFCGMAVAADYRVGERLPNDKTGQATHPQYHELQWDNLIPKGWNPLAGIKGLNLQMLQDGDPRADEALEKLRSAWDNAPVNKALDGQSVRIAGFVVPLDRQGDQVSEFLLVPYFGACIHTPPPPSNQTILVIPDKPLKGVKTMDAYWVSGTLKVAQGDSGLGKYGYQIRAQKLEPYQFKSKR